MARLLTLCVSVVVEEVFEVILDYVVVFSEGRDCSQVANWSTIVVGDRRVLKTRLASSVIHCRDINVLLIFLGTSSQNSLSIGIEKFTQLLEKQMQRPCLEDSCLMVALETPSH